MNSLQIELIKLQIKQYEEILDKEKLIFAEIQAYESIRINLMELLIDYFKEKEKINFRDIHFRCHECKLNFYENMDAIMDMFESQCPKCKVVCKVR